jgi:hypothetical protein
MGEIMDMENSERDIQQQRYGVDTHCLTVGPLSWLRLIGKSKDVNSLRMQGFRRRTRE